MRDMAESLVNDFSPSDPSSVGLAWASLLQVGILAWISTSAAVWALVKSEWMGQWNMSSHPT